MLNKNLANLQPRFEFFAASNCSGCDNFMSSVNKSLAIGQEKNWK